MLRIKTLTEEQNNGQSGDHIDKDLSEKIGVTPYAIEVSLVSAVIHVIFEVINLKLEARTSETTFKDYMVACYNARQGWIPQQSAFSANEKKAQTEE